MADNRTELKAHIKLNLFHVIIVSPLIITLILNLRTPKPNDKTDEHRIYLLTRITTVLVAMMLAYHSYLLVTRIYTLWYG